jgi:hypothetical protein
MVFTMVGRTLGVVCCLVLADELVHVVSRDDEVARVLVVKGEEGEVLERKLRENPRTFDMAMVDQVKLLRLDGDEGLTVLVRVLPAGPHNNSGELRAAIEGAVDEICERCDSIFLFYGLCRNSLYKTERIADRIGKPVSLLVDTEGHTVDDCFGASIGGKRPYLNAIKENHGTIFVFPGYAENWYRRQGKKDLVKVVEQVEQMRFVFERTGYDRVMMLQNGLGDQDKFSERVNGFARMFDFQVLDRKCSLDVFEHSYAEAKKALDRCVGQKGQGE